MKPRGDDACDLSHSASVDSKHRRPWGLGRQDEDGRSDDEEAAGGVARTEEDVEERRESCEKDVASATGALAVGREQARSHRWLRERTRSISKHFTER